MTDWRGIPLEGRIVRLEPLRPDHEDGLWEASRDPETWRWISLGRPHTRADVRAMVEEALGRALEGREIPFVTIAQASDAVIGSTRYLALHPEWRSLEIGSTWLTPAAWGTGANTEAKLLQLSDAFERLGCRRVELKTDALNARSRAAIAALPAQFEGIHRQHMLVRDGENRDTAWYSILDNEWPTVRARLEERLRARATAGDAP
jgi:RimJ/RimL family protein N-acetyltransferase